MNGKPLYSFKNLFYGRKQCDLRHDKLHTPANEYYSLNQFECMLNTQIRYSYRNNSIHCSVSN